MPSSRVRFYALLQDRNQLQFTCEPAGSPPREAGLATLDKRLDPFPEVLRREDLLSNLRDDGNRSLLAGFVIGQGRRLGRTQADRRDFADRPGDLHRPLAVPPVWMHFLD